MTRVVLVGLVATVAACFQQHDPDAVEVRGASDCYSCHRSDYEDAGIVSHNSVGCLSATPPIHVGNKPTDCGMCHMTDSWCPALDGGHDASNPFVIDHGAHANYMCLDCHVPALGPSDDGQNTDCINCHTGAHSMNKMNDKHQEEPGYSWNPAMPHFCLECHPTGRGD